MGEIIKLQESHNEPKVLVLHTLSNDSSIRSIECSIKARLNVKNLSMLQLDDYDLSKTTCGTDASVLICSSTGDAGGVRVTVAGHRYTLLSDENTTEANTDIDTSRNVLPIQRNLNNGDFISQSLPQLKPTLAIPCVLQAISLFPVLKPGAK